MDFPAVALLDTFEGPNENPISEGGKWVKATSHIAGLLLSKRYATEPEAPRSLALWSPATFSEPVVAVQLAGYPGGRANTWNIIIACGKPVLEAEPEKGYVLAFFREGATGLYKITILRDDVLLTYLEEQPLLNEDWMGLLVNGGLVSAWRKTGGVWSRLLSVTDSTYTEGLAGVGSGGTDGTETPAGLRNFSAASTPPPEPVVQGAQGNPFTYPAVDLLTQDALDPLPYTGVSFGREINRAGPWSGQLLISDPRVQEMDYLGSSNTGMTALFVDYLGSLIWGGVLWTRRYKESTKTFMVSAQEFGSYFAQRLQAKDYATTWEGEEHSADPMVIAETILNDAQNREPEPDVAPAKIMGGIAIVITRREAGAPPVSVSYPGTQLQTVDSIISTLSLMGYKAGFDYSFDVAYLPHTKTPAVTLNFWYPSQGRSAAEANITIGPADCVDWTYDEDSSKQADLVVGTGTGSGGLQPASASAAPPGYPLLEKATSYSQVNNEGVLANIVFGELAQTVYSVTTPALILPVPMPDAQGHIDPSKFRFGDFELGDELTFRCDPVASGSMNASPRFPDGMKFTWRIGNWTCAVADQGLSTLTFNLGIPPVGETSIPPPKPPLR